MERRVLGILQTKARDLLLEMKAAVIGSPISHSLSPLLHQAAYEQLGLDHTYSAIEIDQETFPSFIDSLDSNWLGLSLTMPLKEIAFEVVQTVSEVAALAGSINTILINNELSGDNTDIYGLAKAITETTSKQISVASIFGAGATTRSALVALEGLGVEDIYLLARNPEKVAKCVDLGNELGISVDMVPEISTNFLSTDLVINTTPKGVADDFAQFISKPNGLYFDVVYDPWPTKFAHDWLAQGGQVIAGHQMLLHQAVRQVQLMTGKTPDVAHMQNVLTQELRRRGQLN